MRFQNHRAQHVESKRHQKYSHNKCFLFGLESFFTQTSVTETCVYSSTLGDIYHVNNRKSKSTYCNKNKGCTIHQTPSSLSPKTKNQQYFRFNTIFCLRAAFLCFICLPSWEKLSTCPALLYINAFGCRFPNKQQRNTNKTVLPLIIAVLLFIVTLLWRRRTCLNPQSDLKSP